MPEIYAHSSYIHAWPQIKNEFFTTLKYVNNFHNFLLALFELSFIHKFNLTDDDLIYILQLIYSYSLFSKIDWTQDS